jgi:transposase InsO family protein
VNLHRRARTTPESRALLARRVFEEGWSRRRAGRAFGISLPTVRKWLVRWEMAGVQGLGDRSSRPQRSPRRIRSRDRERILSLRRQKRTAVAIAEITGISRATVGRVLRSERLSRWKSLFPREPDRRYERAVAGELLHLDIKKLGRIVGGPGHRVTGDRRGQREGSGWECAHVCVDDHSRLSYVEILPDEKRETTSAFLQRALHWYALQGVTPQALLTDNGSAYRSVLFADACRQRGLRHLFTRPYRPRTNGKAERFIRTALTEWAYRRPFRSSAERARALQPWLHHYNFHRRHTALGGRPPASRVNNLLSAYI